MSVFGCNSLEQVKVLSNFGTDGGIKGLFKPSSASMKANLQPLQSEGQRDPKRNRKLQVISNFQRN
jgi:hypothetical protein